jgi:hypothetical protein
VLEEDEEEYKVIFGAGGLYPPLLPPPPLPLPVSITVWLPWSSQYVYP